MSGNHGSICLLYEVHHKWSSRPGPTLASKTLNGQGLPQCTVLCDNHSLFWDGYLPEFQTQTNAVTTWWFIKVFFSLVTQDPNINIACVTGCLEMVHYLMGFDHGNLKLKETSCSFQQFHYSSACISLIKLLAPHLNSLAFNNTKVTCVH
jgi:hypothetical protein